MPIKREDNPAEMSDGGGRAAVRPRSAAFFRTLVTTALAAAPLGGCYESTPDEDVAADGADARDADAADARDDGVIPGDVYGVPDGGDVVPVPHYGAPEYGAP